MNRDASVVCFNFRLLRLLAGGVAGADDAGMTSRARDGAEFRIVMKRGKRQPV